MYGKVKKAVVSAATGLLALGAFAEGQTVAPIDTTTAGAAADAVGTAISGLISGKIMTNVLIVIGAGLVIFGIFLAVRWTIRGGKTAAK